MKFYIAKEDLQRLEDASKQVGGVVGIRAYLGRQDSMIEVEIRQPLAVGVAGCKAAWLDTLKAMGSSRTFLMAAEEQLIARAVQSQGAEVVELALFGARFEPATESFDPRNHIDISRVLMPREGTPRIQKYVEWGVKGRTKQQVAQERRVEPQKAAESEEYVEPTPEVKAILRQAGFGSIVKDMPK